MYRNYYYFSFNTLKLGVRKEASLKMVANKREELHQKHLIVAQSLASRYSNDPTLNLSDFHGPNVILSKFIGKKTIQS